METVRRGPFPFLWLRFVLGFAVAAASPLRAADDLSDVYRLNLSLHHPIRGDFTGFVEVDHQRNPELQYRAYSILWPGLTYKAARWALFTAGLRSAYTDNETKADTLELRPFAGVKLFLPNGLKWQIYNYTRYEFRDMENLDTHEWSGYSRIRSRFGVEVPLASRAAAWKPRTAYALADVEPTATMQPKRCRTVGLSSRFVMARLLGISLAAGETRADRTKVPFRGAPD